MDDKLIPEIRVNAIKSRYAPKMREREREKEEEKDNKKKTETCVLIWVCACNSSIHIFYAWRSIIIFLGALFPVLPQGHGQ